LDRHHFHYWNGAPRLSLIPDPSIPLTVELDYDKSLKYRLRKLATQLIRPSSRGY
jgi:hypothetical protein